MLAKGFVNGCDQPGVGAGRRRLVWQAAFVLLLLTFSAVAKSAIPELGPVFRTISVNEGLPDRRVEAVIQDANGYIWIGTRGGLVRHEGHRMRFIASDAQDPEPLPGRNIMSLMAHSDGSVWAAVENRGVVQIQPDLTRGRHLEPKRRQGRLAGSNIWSMTEDCDGRVWMAFMRGGVAVYDPDSDELLQYPQSESGGLEPAGFQVFVTTDSRCRVWLAQTGRIGVFDPEAGRFRAVHSLPDGTLAFFVEEAAGRIYFNISGDIYDLGPTASAAESEPELVAEIDGMVTGMAADPHSDHLLIASTGGLYRYSRQGGELQGIRHVPGLANGLPSDTIDSLTVDREGGLWLTTTRSGVAYLPPGSSAFGRYQPVPGQGPDETLGVDPVMSLDWDPSAGGFWVGGLRGEIEFLPIEGRHPDILPQLDAARPELAGAAVLGFLRERDALYVVTQTRVVRIAPDTDNGYELLMKREELDEGTFGTLRRRDEDHIWVATQDVGLFLLDERTGRREHFHPGAEGRRHLPEPHPIELMPGPEGRWWLVAPGGLYRWDDSKGFERQALEQEGPLAAAAWVGDSLWLASDESLQLWRREGNEFTRQREVALQDRLPPGRMIDIIPDAGGNTWLLRTSGLSVYRGGDGVLRQLSQQDGLAPVEFGARTAVTLPDGRLAIGGRGGIVTVDPERVHSVSTAPPVHVSRLQAGDRVFRFSPDRSEPVELPHDRNSLFLDFIATTYLAPERSRYRVKLEGWDEQWIELIGQTRHYYSSLPPGQYRFRVQAAAPDGPWNEEGGTLPITIRRPPWQSGWAIGAYALLVLTGAGAGLQGYRRSNQRRREVRQARQKRALAEEQRQVISRLNRNLEPLPLARTIAGEIVNVTGARRAIIGYTATHLPRELVSTDGDREPPSRESWRLRLDRADGRDELALTLRVAEQDVARVLVDSPDDRIGQSDPERLRLLEEMAGQALHNALLLQRVRALAEHAEQASNAKSEFLATMSHEIRTPLHGVLGMVELLHETETEPGQQDILDTLRQSGLQLQRIIDDVLDISRIEAGRMSLNAQPFDLAATLEQVVDLHAPNAARKGLDLRLRMSATLPLSALGDSDRISQVLGNLLNNAVKFTERGGIELSAEVGDDDQLVLIVSDSGPGIGENDRERLFEPFTQLDASITRSYSGSGLGLAICRRLVDAMDGRLDLLPACHGGSRFRVRLPTFAPPDAPESTRMTRLLDGMVVCASVSAPTLRVLRRLGRRWGVGIADAGEHPRRCDLFLVDPQTLDETDPDRLDEWCREAGALAWLQSPFPSRNGPPSMLPERARFLRWPLVESRFVGLLLDLRIERADDGVN